MTAATSEAAQDLDTPRAPPVVFSNFLQLSIGAIVVSKDDVIACYRLILGREPENESVVSELAERYSTFSELRSAFFCSREFTTARKIDGSIYAAAVPARYGQNQPKYEERGGIFRYEDSMGFLTVGVGGDLPRFFFLTMAIDQIVKERVPGDFAELGVYTGATASVLGLAARRLGRQIYLLDTFEGFDERDLVGIDDIKSVEFADTSVEKVRALVGSESVHFVKGYFPETASQIPPEAIFSLVHIDCDLYEPFRHALNFFWPKISPGGLLVMHDYASLHWDGAEKAVDEFFADKSEGVVLIPDSSGTVVVRKNRIPGVETVIDDLEPETR